MIKDIVVHAYNFAKSAHEGQKRKWTNLPYFTHPKAVARILESLHCSEVLVAAGLLHDVVEDCNIGINVIEEEFGVQVANIVRELTSNKKECARMGKTKYLKEAVLAMTPQALTVKLADRLHNILYLHGDVVPKDFIKRYYKETSDVMECISKKVSLNPTQRKLALMINQQLWDIKTMFGF